MKNNLWKRLIDSKDPLSVKRFVILIVVAHFIAASFATLFMAFFVVFFTVKGKVDPGLLSLLKDIITDDFMIIGGGLGFLTIQDFGQTLIERAKAMASSSSPTVKADNVENVNVDNPDKP